MKVIENHIDRIKSICSLYKVERIYLFGSALTANFTEKSDLDFIVRFKTMELSGYFENYMKFKDELKSLLGREIDLIEEQTLKNPILIQSINRNKELIYG